MHSVILNLHKWKATGKVFFVPFRSLNYSLDLNSNCFILVSNHTGDASAAKGEIDLHCTFLKPPCWAVFLWQLREQIKDVCMMFCGGLKKKSMCLHGSMEGELSSENSFSFLNLWEHWLYLRITLLITGFLLADIFRTWVCLAECLLLFLRGFVCAWWSLCDKGFAVSNLHNSN